MLFAALRHNPAATSLFFGTLPGVVPLPQFFALGNLVRILGLDGMTKILIAKMGDPRPPARPAAPQSSRQ